MSLPLRQVLFFGTLALVFFLLAVELVRRRKLAEEYSLLWVCAAVAMGFLIVRYDFLQWLTVFSGAVYVTSVLLFFGVFFCILLILHLSVRLTKCMREIRTLAQELAILRSEVRDDRPGTG